MTADLRETSLNGEGRLVGAGVPSDAPPERVSPGDMELLLAFQQEVAAAQKAYNTLMMQLTPRYQLSNGDHIGMDGLITRQERGNDGASSEHLSSRP